MGTDVTTHTVPKRYPAGTTQQDAAGQATRAILATISLVSECCVAGIISQEAAGMVTAAETLMVSTKSSVLRLLTQTGKPGTTLQADPSDNRGVICRQ